jgi:hypothetical protein
MFFDRTGRAARWRPSRDSTGRYGYGRAIVNAGDVHVSV